jgi:hypothetical protein
VWKWVLLIVLAVGGVAAVTVILIESLPVSNPFPATTTTTTAPSTQEGLIVGHAAPPCGLNIPSTWTDVISVTRGDVVVARETVSVFRPSYRFLVPPGSYDVVSTFPHTILPIRLTERQTHVATFDGARYRSACRDDV